ncbi:NAD(P)/FAD-dependent oxidoreductase [Lentzea sp. BCCO 10_0798]|uniref:NAD(P)/FAD-dependent oxidoreductase n=1 Tax=Lentzea kristufekii TaxID=3095430 RepID=A0ABU4U552_9PSEU|nr:NAD(P)/FAD-dependent oxidoreductase [Lentzea sp. BCCO 10_0798]MDX8055704.1 NAD(P)/FAD-dependent oxidoreductase [Lentzea sp. BCCO 10_0798]
MHDVIVIGAGPAGLNAALVLGRQQRRTLVLDSGRPRNSPTDEMHMYLSRDGFSPSEFRAIGRAELNAYETVEVREAEVTTAKAIEGGFEVRLADGTSEQARKILLATGQVDLFPEVDGLVERFGKCVFHCPFCHGFEARDKPLAVLGGDFVSAILSLYLADRFSTDVVLCTNGPSALPDELVRKLRDNGVAIRDEPVASVEGELDDLTVVFGDGTRLHRGALFHKTATKQHSALAADLGCERFEDGCVRIDEFQQTSVPGVFAAGDLARQAAFPEALTFVILGAADGARAAIKIDNELFRADAGITPPAARR